MHREGCPWRSTRWGWGWSAGTGGTPACSHHLHCQTQSPVHVCVMCEDGCVGVGVCVSVGM